MTQEDLKAERAALEAAIAERRHKIERMEMVEWYKANDARNEQRRNELSNAYVVANSSAPHTGQQAVTHDLPAEWQCPLTVESRMLMEAVGEEMARMREAMRKDFELEITKLRNEFLQDRLDEARGVRRQASPLSVHSIEELN